MRLIVYTSLRLLVAGTLFLAVVPTVSAGDKPGDTFQTGLVRWHAPAGFGSGWSFSGTRLTAGGQLTLDLASPDLQAETDPYPPLGYFGHNFYNGGSYQVGEATSPIVTAAFGFNEAIASWEADTPAGTWIEVLFRADLGSHWTKWYNLGIWAADTATVERHSVSLQGDADGYVAVDTFVLSAKHEIPTAFQVKVRLFTAGSNVPGVRGLAVAYSTPAPKKASLSTGSPADWNTLLGVPECSQMIYPGGGEVWCSPTSVSMVLGYWAAQGYADPAPQPAGTSNCAQREAVVVPGVFDWKYDGHGNWPFNTAYAASLGYEAYVARFSSLAQAEPWVTAGVPVIMSIAWGRHDLTGAAIPSSNGHLLVLVGFDATGNPVVNDPAAATDEDVQRTYQRAEFETLWLQASGGTVYLIFPAGWAIPQAQ